MSKLSEEQQLRVFKQIIDKDPEFNQKCADCDSKNPTWCSLDLGVFVCMDCSGYQIDKKYHDYLELKINCTSIQPIIYSTGGHRRLGPTVSRIRSYKIDTWMEKDIKIFFNIGNRIANQYYESKLKNSHIKPCQDSPLDNKIDFIRHKYLEKRYVANPSQPTPSQIFMQSGSGQN